MRWFTVLILLLVLALLGWGGMYAYSLSQVKPLGMQGTRIDSAGSSGFILRSELALRNDGPIDVEIRNIRYIIVLDKTGQEIANGSSEGGVVPAGGNVTFPLLAQSGWTPTTEVLRDVLDGGETRATIRGQVQVADLGVTTIDAPFQTSIDLGPLLRQYAQERLDAAMDALRRLIPQ